MTRSLVAIALAALLAPAGAAAQNGTDWWAPLAERLPATDRDPGIICAMVPDLPACSGDAQRAPAPNPDRRDREDDEGWERNDERADRRAERGRAGRGADRAGPPFCRNGKGHPVFGMEWCREKGFGGGGLGDVVWRDVRWEDVILGRRGERPDRQRLDRGGLLDVLGDVVLGRLERQSRAVGGGELTGRLVEGRTRVLQIRAGGQPLAELMDANRDGRVDRILVRGSR